jgi:hypothetical protein
VVEYSFLLFLKQDKREGQYHKPGNGVSKTTLFEISILAAVSITELAGNVPLQLHWPWVLLAANGKPMTGKQKVPARVCPMTTTSAALSLDIGCTGFLRVNLK